MSANRFILTSALGAFLLFSCEKEVFVPQENVIEITPENDPYVPNSNAFIIKGETIVQPAMPIAEVTLSPCGNGFSAQISYMGAPMNGDYRYQIRIAGTNILVDEGTISNGENTNWVLESCTEYDFKFWGCNPSNYSTVQTIRTEGCNGVFDC